MGRLVPLNIPMLSQNPREALSRRGVLGCSRAVRVIRCLHLVSVDISLLLLALGPLLLFVMLPLQLALLDRQ